MIGVIADDLSGAAELGGLGWRYGLTAEVLIEGSTSGETDVACLDTDSRSCPPDEAARRAASATSSLGAVGAVRSRLNLGRLCSTWMCRELCSCRRIRV
jgi:uncharacterized protein YgbK (DUF1537 family)